MTHEFYERHGGKTIILAQFIPILRTFAPVVAGVGEMGYRQFATYNVIGAIAWVGSMITAGYLLGNAIPNIESRIHYVVAVGDLHLAAAARHRVTESAARGTRSRPPAQSCRELHRHSDPTGDPIVPVPSRSEGPPSHTRDR